MKEEISVVVACKPMWQNMRVYQTVTNNPYANINVGLLLVSRMDYTVSVLFCPLVLVVNIGVGVSTETCLSCKVHK
jgi:hypothetical protein